MKVVLFDIDRTLIHSRNVREAMNLAFKEVYGVEDAYKDASISGKTDLLILKEALEKHGIRSNDAQVKRYKDCLCDMLKILLRHDHPEKSVLPGVKGLLDSLKTKKDVKLGLLTGNFKKGAYIKLDYFNLSKYFGFGAFGDDAVLRDDLLPYALRRCNCDNGINMGDIIIVGDTPLDIRCAKVHGAMALGVATGRYSTEVLLEEGADLALDDLKDTGKIISWIFNN